jgi:nitrogen fixation protein NifB
MIDKLNLNIVHPCFSPEAAHNQARIHLPVAKRCNISCNYCNRKYDCLNESRPGVSSGILSPAEALNRYCYYREQLDNLSVVGIAGPGDALADWELTSETMRLVREQDPKVLLCMSTNGLKLPALAPSIVELGVSHLTVTVNTLSPETGAKIYRQVNYQGKKYTGTKGAGLLLEKQLEGIHFITRKGIIVKINIVMIPGINDFEIPDIVGQMKDLGVYIANIMPLIPVKGTAFENIPATNIVELSNMRMNCRKQMRQMFHCQQCRADAVGLLQEQGCTANAARKVV